MADIDRDRLRRDAAGVGPYAGNIDRLVRLSDMGGWNVVEGEPDIRHWEVRTIGGRDLGTVKELLIDPDAGEAVMLEVDLSGSERRALVPLRIVEVDRRARVVRMDSADLAAAEQPSVSDARDAAAPEGAARDGDVPRARSWADSGRVRYPRENDEVVVERRPVVEEVVVRRRVIQPGDSTAEAARAAESIEKEGERRDTPE